MDISAILPVSMGAESSRSLNDDFAAVTPAGDSVFAKPTGDKCIWKTETGTLAVSFFFDPKQKFSRSNVLASVSNDYLSEFREQLTKHLLDEADIAPKKKSMEESYWDTITTTLPKETLAKNVFNDASKLKEFMDLLRENVTSSYREETMMREALTTKEFVFCYEIAIDSYPQQIRGKKIAPGEKTGVLTIIIQGCPESEEKKEASIPTATTTTTTTTTAIATSEAPTKKRKISSNDNGKKEESDKAKLIGDLGLKEALAGGSKHTYRDKEFPLTATLFFEAVGRWFGSTTAAVASKLEKDRNRNPIYQ